MLFTFLVFIYTFIGSDFFTQSLFDTKLVMILLRHPARLTARRYNHWHCGERILHAPSPVRSPFRKIRQLVSNASASQQRACFTDYYAAMKEAKHLCLQSATCGFGTRNFILHPLLIVVFLNSLRKYGMQLRIIYVMLTNKMYNLYFAQ